MSNIVAALRTPPAQTFIKVTFPEGSRSPRWPPASRSVPRLTPASSQPRPRTVRSARARPGVTSLEGLLFPDTYQVGGGEAERRSCRGWCADGRSARSLGHRELPEQGRLSPYQVLIVASMIEREAKIDEDRPKIARVIYNRLARHAPADRRRALLRAGRQHAVQHVDRRIDSPYNTYLHAGLPPTPIANPGRRSIEAALNPASNPDPAACPRPAVPLALLRGGDADGQPRLRGDYDEHQENVRRPAAGLLLNRPRRWRLSGPPGSAGHRLARRATRCRRPSTTRPSPSCGLDWALRRVRGARRRCRRRARPRCGRSASPGCRSRCPTRTTSPRLVDELSPRPAALGAVNCVVVRETAGSGTTPTAPASSTRSGSTTASTRRAMTVVVLGAGGAARAVVLALAGAGCREVVVVNRTPGRGAGGRRTGREPGRSDRRTTSPAPI